MRPIRHPSKIKIHIPTDKVDAIHICKIKYEVIRRVKEMKSQVNKIHVKPDGLIYIDSLYVYVLTYVLCMYVLTYVNASSSAGIHIVGSS